jgi:hypothetical protein
MNPGEQTMTTRTTNHFMQLGNRAPRHLMLAVLGLATAALMLVDSNAGANSCSTQSPNVCTAGLCTPWVGTAPSFDANVCCDAAGTCYRAGTECYRGEEEYDCPFGEVDPASGTVSCYMELASQPVSTEDDPFCCNLNTDICTIFTGSGCDGSGQYVSWCIGDVLIMEDGTAYCFPISEC